MSHASCIKISTEDYEHLGASDNDWLCNACLAGELPFPNCSLDVSNLDISCNTISSTSYSTQTVSTTPILHSGFSVLHANIRSLYSSNIRSLCSSLLKTFMLMDSIMT